ncbi:hypothetical protein [Chryseobacterium rhizosphaerae]|uniref:Uncharacterized protein n=1 Tax=Chryseobacterium rhizosphaerae TaxID=395937 RepID=A0ABX9IRG3_9FLAO|nr:hypothetical protein [Chryseobacterium rhizosphaerae]REC78975.1 hypothetical protein DRF57_01485 [Chryseobacterium rhizosphaerae]GEN68064.1 hypothetical protein CRH01_26320 [Chryseobacterium rhizosphaerae]
MIKIFIPHEDDSDPAMRFEGLARYAFDCAPYGDPDGYAHQSTYNFYFVPEVSEKGVKIIHKILDSLIVKSNPEKSKEFQTVKNSLSEKMKQMTSIHLIDYLITIIKS